jgi:hypothetical protein
LGLPNLCQGSECIIFDPNNFKEKNCSNPPTEIIKTICKIFETIEETDNILCPEMNTFIGYLNSTEDLSPFCWFTAALKSHDVSYCDNLAENGRTPSWLCKFIVTKDQSFCIEISTKEETELTEETKLNCPEFCSKSLDSEKIISRCNELYTHPLFNEWMYTMVLNSLMH